MSFWTLLIASQVNEMHFLLKLYRNYYIYFMLSSEVDFNKVLVLI